MSWSRNFTIGPNNSEDLDRAGVVTTTSLPIRPSTQGVEASILWGMWKVVETSTLLGKQEAEVFTLSEMQEVEVFSYTVAEVVEACSLTVNQEVEVLTHLMLQQAQEMGKDSDDLRKPGVSEKPTSSRGGEEQDIQDPVGTGMALAILMKTALDGGILCKTDLTSRQVERRGQV